MYAVCTAVLSGRRLIGESDKNMSWNQIKAAIDYVKENKEIRDVLITEGTLYAKRQHNRKAAQLSKKN